MAAVVRPPSRFRDPQHWVAQRFGPATARYFSAVSADQRGNAFEWLVALAGADDGAFVAMAAVAVYESVLSRGFAGNWAHFHVRSAAVEHEGRRRAVERGAAAGCPVHNLYAEAHRLARRAAGFGPRHDAGPPPCRCTG